ncbi:hypothetical protein [Streptomyces sp. NPDC001787]|uniref:hypothetical protein n=1 Tax=Streptomyces sp. NPDC001787 TaxID=3154523 RepID=UPI00331A2A82
MDSTTARTYHDAAGMHLDEGVRTPWRKPPPRRRRPGKKGGARRKAKAGDPPTVVPPTKSDDVSDADTNTG